VATIALFAVLKPKLTEQLGPGKYFWVWKIEEKYPIITMTFAHRNTNITHFMR
jgi:hypothetical protein